MRQRRLLPLACGFALALLACGGTSPTESGSTVRIFMNLHSNSASPTILRATLSWDGTVIGTFQPASAAGELSLTSVVQGVRPGRHTIAVTVLGQTSTPNEYLTKGSVFAGEEQILMPQVKGRLATGASLTTPVDL